MTAFSRKRHQTQDLVDFHCSLCKQGVRGSNPLTSTIHLPAIQSLTTRFGELLSLFSPHRSKNVVLYLDLDRLARWLVQCPYELGQPFRVGNDASSLDCCDVGRILIRMARGGQSVPLSSIPESHEESMKSLPEARKHADDVLVYDNTPDGKGHRWWLALSQGNWSE